MRSSVGFACLEAILLRAQSIVLRLINRSGIVEEDANDLSDELELSWIGHGGGVIGMLVLGAIYDRVVHQWGVGVFFVFGHPKAG